MILSMKSSAAMNWVEGVVAEDMRKFGDNVLSSHKIFEGVFFLVDSKSFKDSNDRHLNIQFAKWNKPEEPNDCHIDIKNWHSTIQYLEKCPFKFLKRVNYTLPNYPEDLKQLYLHLMAYHKTFTEPITQGRVYSCIDLEEPEYKIWDEANGSYWKASQRNKDWQIKERWLDVLVAKDRVNQKIPFRLKFGEI